MTTKLIRSIFNKVTKSDELKDIQDAGNAVLDDIEAEQEKFNAKRMQIEDNHKKVEKELKNGARLTKHRIPL